MILPLKPKKAKEYFEAKLSFTTGPAELKSMIERGEDINIVDVRRPEDYAEGHIPGAVNLPKEKWDTLAGLDKDKVNVVYCYSETCHLAATGAVDFADHGYRVMELEGGFDTWKSFHYTVEKLEAVR